MRRLDPAEAISYNGLFAGYACNEGAAHSRYSGDGIGVVVRCVARRFSPGRFNAFGARPYPIGRKPTSWKGDFTPPVGARTGHRNVRSVSDRLSGGGLYGFLGPLRSCVGVSVGIAPGVVGRGPGYSFLFGGCDRDSRTGGRSDTSLPLRLSSVSGRLSRTLSPLWRKFESRPLWMSQGDRNDMVRT